MKIVTNTMEIPRSPSPLPSSCSREPSVGGDRLDVPSSVANGDTGSGNYSDLSTSKSSEKPDKKPADKKRKNAWYNVLNPNYKSKSDDFKKLFKELPESERLLVDYSCALQRDILVHGRLYISQNYICFYANIFRWETTLSIKWRDVTSMTKERTARVIPNAIQITTDSERYFLTSFGARDKAYLMLFRIWQNALMDQPMLSQELWQWIHFSYGEELGLTSDDDDYVAPRSSTMGEDDIKMLNHNNNQHYLPRENSNLPIAESFPSSPLPIPASPAGQADSGSDNNAAAVPLESIDPASERDSPIFKTMDQIRTKDIREDDVKLISESPELHVDLKPRAHGDGEIPTDFSDSTDSDAEENSCGCLKHEGKELFNTIIPLSVDQVFTLVFTGSKFYKDLLTYRKTYDLIESPWQLCSDAGDKMRQVSYTVTLNHAMAKNAKTTETQSLLKHSKPGQSYVVDCDIVSTGIPYGDTFTVKAIYCLTKVSSHQCRIRVHGAVHYKKGIWGLIKSMVEKSAIQGILGFCVDLEEALLKEAERTNQHPKKPRRRKRAKVCGIGATDGTIKSDSALKDIPAPFHSPSSFHSLGARMSSPLSSFDWTIKIILFALIVLLIINVILIYKLWGVDSPPLSHPIALDGASLDTLSKEDFIHLLRQQEELHRAETSKWQNTIKEVIKLIQMIEASLSNLKGALDSYGSTEATSFSHQSSNPLDSSGKPPIVDTPPPTFKGDL